MTRSALAAALLAGALGLGSPAAAQSFPGAYSVTGVAANDVLNIRAQPNAQAPILGTLGPYGINIEVLDLAPDGRWGRVGVPEGNGWVNMRYLAAQPGPPPGQVARPLRCFGTEPFWSLDFTLRGTEWNDPGRSHPAPLTVLDEDGGAAGYFASLAQGAALTHRVIIRREACSDGMSDRAYGWAVTRFSSAPGRVEIEQGCCTLDAR